MKTAYLIALLMVTFAIGYPLDVFSQIMSRMVWSNQTLYLNVIANRQGWKACKRYNICDQNQEPQPWTVIWSGESHWRS